MNKLSLEQSLAKATLWSSAAKKIERDSTLTTDLRRVAALKRAALGLRVRAAKLFEKVREEEPLRGRLYLLAADAALELGKTTDAMRLASEGLLGSPESKERRTLERVRDEALLMEREATVALDRAFSPQAV